jgi:hypothetical protein
MHTTAAKRGPVHMHMITAKQAPVHMHSLRQRARGGRRRYEATQVHCCKQLPHGIVRWGKNSDPDVWVWKVGCEASQADGTRQEEEVAFISNCLCKTCGTWLQPLQWNPRLAFRK